MTRKTKDRIILCAVLLLVIALTFSIFIIVQKNNRIADIKRQIEQNESVLNEQYSKAAQLELQLRESEENKEKIQSELDSIKKAKEKLENENKSLKTQIQELKAAKPAAAKTVVQAIAPQTPSSGKICYLTFDDGPTDNTLEILKILDKYKIKATFFVVNTDKNKIEYVKNIYAAGHSIGLHSASHNYAKIYSSKQAYFDDLNSISKAVEQLVGIKTSIIRFPGGSSNLVSRQYTNKIMTELTKEVTAKGYVYFDWNVDSGDATETAMNPKKIVNNVLSGAANKTRICVLMHDSAAKTTTVEALPEIIEGLAAKGFRFAALTPQIPVFHHNVQN